MGRVIGREIGGMRYNRIETGRQAAGMLREMLERGGAPDANEVRKARSPW